MSDSDSFIDEVTEEVRRDRLFKQFRRYGWIAVVAILLLVGGATWNEWQKAQARQEAEALGDEILAALDRPDRQDRADALAGVSAQEGAANAVLQMLVAGELGTAEPEAAATRLLGLAEDPDVPQIYRQIAVLKAVALPQNGLSAEDRRERLEGLLPGGGLVRLLAEEQLALLDIETGATGAALERLVRISEDAEATAGLRRRAAQVIVALDGGDSLTQGN